MGPMNLQWFVGIKPEGLFLPAQRVPIIVDIAQGHLLDGGLQAHPRHRALSLSPAFTEFPCTTFFAAHLTLPVVSLS